MIKKSFALVEQFLASASRPPVVVILGPTASGKTALAIEIAKKFDGEVISADSRQIFRHFVIGVNTATEAEMEGIPHHGLGFLEPNTPFFAPDFQKFALQKIAEIRSRKRLPIVVGGTMLYVDSLTKGFAFPTGSFDATEREKLEAMPTETLRDEIFRLDPKTAEKIEPNNRIFLIRAIEIAKSGVPKSARKSQKPTDDEFLSLGIEWSREVLYDRINRRAEAMWHGGLLNETKWLSDHGFLAHRQPATGIGYPEALEFLDGRMSETEAIDLLQKNTRHYAKRQILWWRRDPKIVWLQAAE